LRVFAWRDGKIDASQMRTMTTTNNMTLFWEQIGQDIVFPRHEYYGAVLTDHLVVAIGLWDAERIGSMGVLYTYQYRPPLDNNHDSDTTSSSSSADWVSMAPVMEMKGATSAMQLVHASSNNTSTEPGTLILALGYAYTGSVETCRYETETGQWIQFGRGLQVSEDKGPFTTEELGYSWLSLSRNGEIVAFGRQDALQMFAYDAARDNWMPIGQGLQKANSSSTPFNFGQFALSANGKMLVATTFLMDDKDRATNMSMSFSGQIQTWDFVPITNEDNDNMSAGGAWIQRHGEAAVLEVSWTVDAFSSHNIAVSEDGNHLAASFCNALTSKLLLLPGRCESLNEIEQTTNDPVLCDLIGKKRSRHLAIDFI
jgi:hypothetical protein